MKTWRRFTQLVVMALFLAVSLSGCGEDEGEKPKKYQEDIADQQELTPNHIRLLGPEGTPLVGAQYLIGLAQNAPFEGNFGVTNERGEFPIPAGWTDPQMLTVDAPGFLRATYIQLEPKAMNLRLTPKVSMQAELRGRTTGHPVRNKDNIVDFSLVMSAMSRQDLLNFQLHKVISPLNDKISAVGQEADIPSNISLPRQTEKKFFIDVTLDKPQYRLQVGQTGPQRFFVARGRFPFNSVVDGLLDKKNVVDLMNYFSITGGSLRDVNVVGGVNTLDVPVMDLTFSQKRTYKAPKLASNQVLIALAASDNGGYLIPTDFKRVTSQQSINLSVGDENPLHLAQVLKNAAEFQLDGPGVDRLSAILSTFTDSPPQDFLPLLANPRVPTRWKFHIPEVSSPSVNQLTTYAILSDVKISNVGGSQRRDLTKVWEIYAPSWVKEIEIPHWPWNRTSNLTRVEISLVGNQIAEDIPLGPEMLQKATHVTRSSLDF